MGKKSLNLEAKACWGEIKNSHNCGNPIQPVLQHGRHGQYFLIIITQLAHGQKNKTLRETIISRICLKLECSESKAYGKFLTCLTANLIGTQRSYEGKGSQELALSRTFITHM